MEYSAINPGMQYRVWGSYRQFDEEPGASKVFALFDNLADAIAYCVQCVGSGECVTLCGQCGHIQTYGEFKP